VYGLLDGRIEVGLITQVYGAPGSRKTELCLPLTSDALDRREVPALTGDNSLTFVFPKRNPEFLKYRVDGDRLIVEKMRGDEND
jgi:RecA/RadA recombinase